MKIALVSPYDFAYPGGVASHITNLDSQLQRLGHDVRVIAPASRAVNTFGDRFLPIGRPRSLPSSGSIVRITLSVTLADHIRRVLDQEKFDIVHLHEPFMPMLCSAVLRFSETVNVGTFHACEGVPGYYFGWPVTPFLIRRRARKLGGRIAVSRPALEYARHHLPGEYEIIPNGVDTRHFNPAVLPFEEYRDGKRNLLFVGRLEKRKGLAYLLRAYARVKKEMPGTRLIVVGMGTRLRKRYERFVAQHGLQGDVVFKGFVSYDDLARYFRTADVYCSPATGHESLGVVLLEGLASGTPVVASDIPGYSTVISNGQDGLLFPPRDSGRLADCLLQVLNDRDLSARLSAAGLKTAASYAWERVGERVAGFYRSVLAAQG